MTHAHVTSWFLAVVLFVIAYMLYKKGDQKKSKIFHMIARLMYLLIIATGGKMLFDYLTDPTIVNRGPLIIKMILGLSVIGLMEIILVQKKRGVTKLRNWAFFWITFLLTLYYGWNVL
ncbi:YisL family protein [Fictibacillus iocasae]|uniref:YisL family protein n=1 Tax=Fictibacillus iocasae TaxID=2715437 RepID=A0ABW2NUP6_9BACL